MKRLFLFAALVLISSLLTSCFSQFEIPVGKWECQEPHITLNLTKGECLGTYDHPEEGEIQIIVHFQFNSSQMGIYTYNDDKSTDETLFAGMCHLENNELIYTLFIPEERDGEKLIFKKVVSTQTT